MYSLNTRFSSFFKRAEYYTKDLPCGETLEFMVITTLMLFIVTNASIIKIDFFKKFYNFFSMKYKSLCYQVSFWNFG